MKPGYAAASIAGILFGIAWWLFISACISVNKTSKVEFKDALPITGATIGFILLITFNWGYLDAQDEEYNSKCANIAACSRILLFFCHYGWFWFLSWQWYLVSNEMGE